MALNAIEIIMCMKLLLIIYKLSIERTGLRIAFIERYLATSIDLVNVSEDDRRNLSHIYKTLFSADCHSYFEKLYSDAMKEMGLLSYDQSDEILNGLMFIQETIATALWKYHCDVNQSLESFARQFDRLDLPAERKRLHDLAQER